MMLNKPKTEWSDGDKTGVNRQCRAADLTMISGMKNEMCGKGDKV